MARLKPDERKELILKAAVKLAEKKGYNNILRDDIAKAADVANGLVTHYLGTMQQLRRAVMGYAIKHEVLSVIAQGLAARDPRVKNISDDLKKRVIESM